MAAGGSGMRIVIDANILFSALIKDSLTRKIILEYEERFLFPKIIFTEAEKHKDELLKKSRLSAEEFSVLFALLMQKMQIVPDETLKPFYDAAYEIIKEIDPDDALFIACALAYPGSVLWTNDKKLKLQIKVRIIETSELMGALKL